MSKTENEKYIKQKMAEIEAAREREANGTLIPPEPPLSETEQAILDTAINVDYLVCLRDMEI